MDERVWLRHKETGHLWECPSAAVEAWTTPDMGWEVTDERPVESNPVVAELLAFQAERQAAVAAETNTKTSRKSGTNTTPQEG